MNASIFSGVSPKRNATAKDTASDREHFTERVRNDPLFEDAAGLALDMWFLDDSRDGSGKVYRMASSDAEDVGERSQFSTRYALQTLGGISAGLPGRRDFINFYGRAGAIPQVSWEQILRGDVRFLRENFESKVVLTGFLSSRGNSTSLAKDEFLVPVGTMFGVEIHATITANLLDGSWIRRLALNEELKIVVGITGILLAMGIMFRLVTATCVVMSSVVVVIVACYLLFSHYLLWLPLVGPTVTTAILVLLANLVIGFFDAERKNRIHADFWDFDREA